jgi:hypothetical protein
MRENVQQCMDWINLSPNRDHWWAFVNAKINLHFQ